MAKRPPKLISKYDFYEDASVKEKSPLAPEQGIVGWHSPGQPHYPAPNAPAVYFGFEHNPHLQTKADHRAAQAAIAKRIGKMDEMQKQGFVQPEDVADVNLEKEALLVQFKEHQSAEQEAPVNKIMTKLNRIRNARSR